MPAGTPFAGIPYPAQAPLLWDMPYWNGFCPPWDNRADLQSPHAKGLNATYADGHARFSHFHSTPTYIAEPGPHPLYASPDSIGSVVAELREREYGLYPLEVKDDWMKVRVQWPGPWCAERAVRTAEGWIRWRTPERGPRLAIYLIC